MADQIGTDKGHTMSGGGYNDEPTPEIPDLEKLTPTEAWNAAINACIEIAEWGSFWDDGQRAPDSMTALLVKVSEQ